MALGCPGLTDGFYVPRSSPINQDRPLFYRSIFSVPLELSSRNTPLRERQAWWISVHQVHSSTSAHNSRRGCGPQAPTKPITNNLQKSPTSPRSRGAWRGGNDTSPVIVRISRKGYCPDSCTRFMSFHRRAAGMGVIDVRY